MFKKTFTISIQEQCKDFPIKTVKVKILFEAGKLWIQPAGYGDKTSAPGHGYPLSLEIWQGRLRLIVFRDIKIEDPSVIDLENAQETAGKGCNWCGKEINGPAIKWKGLLFCSEPCLDACRATQ